MINKRNSTHVVYWCSCMKLQKGNIYIYKLFVWAENEYIDNTP